ncbi:MAG TPA: hypothetical protein DCG34_08285 [Clostridiales bacterium]|jgi:ADP-heptose:LPS heptosyltransferase|nr:hypothetical protein [Clostridiales bacterium]
MKSFLGAFKYLFKRFYLTVIFGPLGLFYLLTRFREKNTCYVVPCPHIGDVLFTFGYLNAYKNKNNIKRLVVVCTKSFKELAQMYPDDVDDIFVVSDYVMNLILSVDASYFYALILKKLSHVLIIVPPNHFRGDFSEISRFPGVTLIGSIKYGILGLEEKDSFAPPVKQDEDVGELLDRLGIISGKTIILSPYSHGREAGIDISIFEAISSRYGDLGYKVLTNVSANWHKPIRKTKALCCTLREAYLISEYCSCVIGIRSGFLDLTLLSGTMVLALYQSNHTGTDYFDLRAMPIVNYGLQYRLTDDFDNDITSIYEIIDNNLVQGEKS